MQTHLTVLRVSGSLQLGMQEEQSLLRASSFTTAGLREQRGGGLQTSTCLCLLTSFLYLIISSVDGGEEGLAPGTGMDGHQSHPHQREKGQGS